MVLSPQNSVVNWKCSIWVVEQINHLWAPSQHPVSPKPSQSRWRYGCTLEDVSADFLYHLQTLCHFFLDSVLAFLSFINITDWVTILVFMDWTFLSFFKKRFYLFIFREKRREGEREGEKNQCVTMCPLVGTWPETQACVLTGNQTGDPLLHRPTLNPLSYTSQDWNFLDDVPHWLRQVGVGGRAHREDWIRACWEYVRLFHIIKQPESSILHFSNTFYIAAFSSFNILWKIISKHIFYMF